MQKNMANPWAYINVSTKQGNTDGEFMFDFTPYELGRDEKEEAAVRADLEMIFGHKLSSYKLELIFLTLQEFQVLTIKYGDFFANTRKVPKGQPKVRKQAIQHFSGISAGMSNLDSMNTVRVSNAMRNFDGNRIAILKEGPWERALLYFNKTQKGPANAITYRDVAIGDVLLLEEYTLGRDDNMTVELKNANPTFHFAVENKTIDVTPSSLPTTNSKYYYISTASQALAASQREGYAVFSLGYIAAVHKNNTLTNMQPSGHYHQIRSPAMQRNTYSVVLTSAWSDLMMRFGYTIPASLVIGASAPKEKEKENVPIASPLKRTSEQANLPVSASTTSAKINRKTQPAAASSAVHVNPAT